MGDKLVYSQMTYYQRAKLKELLDAGLSKECIAEKLKVSRGTVFNELKRGSVEGVYDPEYADEKAWEKRTESRNKTILEKDQRFPSLPFPNMRRTEMPFMYSNALPTNNS